MPPIRRQTEEDKLIEAFCRAGKNAGCPQDQVANFLKAGVVLQPKQLEMSAAARACDVRCANCESLYQSGQSVPEECPDCGPLHVGVGGPRGGAKSHWMMAQVACDDCQRRPGLKFLYLRKTGKAMREQIRDLLLKTCKHVPHNYREQAGLIEFPNGSFIVVGHFKDEKDIENYIGQEYDGIAVEELTTLTFEKHKNLMSCLRSSKPGWRPRSYSAWNWGGVGHGFVMKLFYEPWEKKTERVTRYVMSRVEDNRFNNPEYVNYLKSLTGWKYKSWYLGDPHFQAGQFFTTWNEKFHVLRAFDEKHIVRWKAGLDYGRTHPTVFLLAGETKDGELIFLDEHSEAQMTIEEHAVCIFAMLKRHNLDIRDLDFIAAGKDCFSAKDDGTTISDTYEENGIILTPAEIDRINGWSKCAERLGDPEKGIKPSILVHERCKNLIEQIPLAQHHEKRPEDVEKMDADENGEGGDDALDCWRFVVASDPSKALSWAKPLGVAKPRALMC